MAMVTNKDRSNGLKQRVKILTVDPKTRRIEGVLKDLGIIQVAVFEVPAQFRWPKEGETWTVTRENNFWMLGSSDEQPGASKTIQDIAPGDTLLGVDNSATHVVGSLNVNNDPVVTSTDSRLTNLRTPLDNSVTTIKIVDLNVTTAKLANASVTAIKMAVNSISTGNIVDLSVTTAKLDASAVTNATVSAVAAIDETKLNLASDAAAITPSRRTLGVGALQATAGNDIRLTDARTPTAHAASHLPSGTDPLIWPGTFSAGRAAAQSVPTGAYTPIVMTTEEWDTSNWFNPTTGRFTPLLAGYYRLSTSMAIGTTVANATRLIAGIFKNGALHRVFQAIYVAGGNDDILGGTATVLANGTTDYFEPVFHQNTAGAINVGGDVRSTFFQGELITRL